jgi:hypothetical protein
MTADQVVAQARSRCNQENLLAQLKGGVRALHAPVNTLVANWAYMTMASLAWSIKAWCALLLPISPRWAAQHNELRKTAESGHPFRTIPDTQYGSIRTGGRLKADTSK